MRTELQNGGVIEPIKRGNRSNMKMLDDYCVEITKEERERRIEEVLLYVTSKNIERE